MNRITATRCILEPQVSGHAQQMYEVLSDPAIYEFENEPPPSEDWLRKRYLRQESRGSEDGKQVWLNWVLCIPSGHLAGYVQATVLRSGSSYVAYEINSRFWRQGIATSAIQAMLAELRDHYEVRLAIAVLKAKNFRSEGLLLKLGFSRALPPDEARYRDTEDEVAYTLRLAPEPDAA